jgi:hypothetical protein
MVDRSAGAETNTLAAPTLRRSAHEHRRRRRRRTGTRAITVATAVNQAGNHVLTFAQVKDFIALIGIKMNGVLDVAHRGERRRRALVILTGSGWRGSIHPSSP